ncbi:hypothetical protein V5F53_09915 [Xanthobacter sp. V4C-4]|uniref:hypothetical protein n=1 Tax=Xanthobacter cornucopiae TaxID=3119924 RepID=UPI00372BCA5D
MARAELNEDGPTLVADMDVEAWDVMVQRLHAAARQNGRPTDIDNHKINDGAPVPFIDAIIAIEPTLTTDYQRYDTRAFLAHVLRRAGAGAIPA